MLRVMNVVFWIIFIGLCIKTGAYLFSFFVSLFINPEGAKDLYMDLNLYHLYTYNQLHYIQIVSYMIALSGFKAYMAYQVVKLFMDFNLNKPFSSKLVQVFVTISYIAIGTGVLALIADAHCKWLLNKGVEIAYEWGSGEILFFGGVIYILSLIFKKGYELQNENDLTV
jgi:hypothetical protein